MDRNNFGVDTTTQILVALLAEGVDRNSQEDAQKYVEDVALLAEGVDRNSKAVGLNIKAAPSPSSRRAWIEIVKTSGFCNGDEVALLAEGVDRNLKLVMLVAAMGVALLAEGVDRNFKSWVAKRSISASPSSRRAWIEIL